MFNFPDILILILIFKIIMCAHLGGRYEKKEN